MQILVSELPKNPWWGRGIPVYQNNWAMKRGVVPSQEILQKEHVAFIKTLQSVVTVVTIPFPPLLDTPANEKHDFVFVRDSFVSNRGGKMILANFSERNRQGEVAATKEFLEKEGYTTQTVSEDAYVEGGEFYFIPGRQILFAGMNRANKKGVEEVAALLGVTDCCIIETEVFHLDTIFTVLLDLQGELKAVLVSLSHIKNKVQLMEFLEKYHVRLIEIDAIDTIGFQEKIGKMAANALAIPGVLIGGTGFATPGVEEKIVELGIKHLITPVTQFCLSGGGVHCLTNELM